MFGLCHVVKQKFQDEGATEAATFDFKVLESYRSVYVLNVLNSDETGILHGIGKAVAPLSCGRDADVVFAAFAEAFLAHVLVAIFAVIAAEPATFIAKKFDLLLLRISKRIQFVELLVEPEIGNDIAEFFAVQFRFELLKIGDNFR